MLFVAMSAIIVTSLPVKADEDRGDHNYGMMNIGTTTMRAIGTVTKAIGNTNITSIRLFKWGR